MDDAIIKKLNNTNISLDQKIRQLDAANITNPDLTQDMKQKIQQFQTVKKSWFLFTQPSYQPTDEDITKAWDLTAQFFKCKMTSDIVEKVFLGLKYEYNDSLKKIMKEYELRRAWRTLCSSVDNDSEIEDWVQGIEKMIQKQLSPQLLGIYISKYISTVHTRWKCKKKITDFMTKKRLIDVEAAKETLDNQIGQLHNKWTSEHVQSTREMFHLYLVKLKQYMIWVDGIPLQEKEFIRWFIHRFPSVVVSPDIQKTIDELHIDHPNHVFFLLMILALLI